MIIHDCEQGTEEWLTLRLGMPTASNFADIYSATGKPSTRAQEYMYKLVAESLAGEPVDTYKNEWMQRGNDLEPDAVSAYEFINGVETQVLGFVTNDEKTIGCSPDRMNLEIKCPMAKTHVKYLDEGKCPAIYYPQVQGCIWLCETDRWDFMSYHPKMPPLICTVFRDDTYIKGLEKALYNFLDAMEKMKIKIGEKNVY